MRPHDDPLKEKERIEALRSYSVLDTAPERAFDDLTVAAAALCSAPISLVSLVDESRQWFKSRFGLDTSETPREHAFCARAIESPGPMVVPDAAADPRFASNPLVAGPPGIRFYAGLPLFSPEGFGLGTLCVIDRRPRTLEPEQLTALGGLARVVVDQLEARRVAARLADALERTHLLQAFLPMCAGCKKIRDDDGSWLGVDSYLWKLSGEPVSHTVCPDCLKDAMNE